MASFSRLYLSNQTAPYTPATLRGAWDDTAGVVTRALVPEKLQGGGAHTTVARAETNGAANFDVLLYRGVSGPLAAQTISGSIDVLIGAQESSLSADFSWHIHVYATQGDSDTPRGTLLSDYVETTSHEWTNSSVGRALAAAQALASLAVSQGDRLVIEIGYVALNVVTTSFTGTLRYGLLGSLNEPLPDVSLGGAALNTASFVTFTDAIDESQALAVRATQAVVEFARVVTSSPVRLTQSAVEYILGVLPPVRVTQTVLEYIARVAPGPGGEVEEGVNPAVSDLPTGVLRLFFELRLQGSPSTTVVRAETMLRDPSSWYGGKKTPGLLSVSEIERELTSDGSFRGTEVRVVVADDEARTFRTLATTDTLSGAYAAIYLVSDEVRYALGEPYRLFAGKVHGHRALPGFRYEFVVRDVLSDLIAELDSAPRIPPDRLTLAQFPGMDAKYDGVALPMVIGLASDATEVGITDPQGVVPPIILGQINFATAWGGINQNVIACVWSAGALAANGVWQVYYNTPDQPDVRIPVPLSAWGGPLWTPGMPGWSETGLATDYADYPLPLGPTTRRYTPFFVDATHPLAQAFIDGRVLAAGNLYGIAENADGTGLYLSDAPRVWQWLIVNQLFQPYVVGDYAPIPTLDDTYSIIDTGRVEATVTRLRSIGGGSFPVGFLLGRGGQQQTLRHVLQELCAGVLMDQGINRHGQLMVDAEDPTAPAEVSLSDLFDIEDGEFTVWVDRGAYRNRLEYTYGFRYVPPSAPRAAPAEGEPLPAEPIAPYQEWTSGLQTAQHTGAIEANGGQIKTHVHENYVVRHSTTAGIVANNLLLRLVGPSPSYDGPRMFRLTTSWQGLGNGSAEIELGTVIAITHLEGLGPTGYEGQRGRVMKIAIDPQRARVTLEGRLLFGAES